MVSPDRRPTDLENARTEAMARTSFSIPTSPERLLARGGPSNLILFQLAAARQLAIYRAIPAERFRIRAITDATRLMHSLRETEDAAVLIEWEFLDQFHRQELVRFLASGAPRPWLLGLSVPPAFPSAEIQDCYQAGIDWLLVPEEPVASIVRHLLRWQDLHALARENSLLNAAMRTVPSGVSVVDMRLHDQPLIYVNDTFVSMTGYSKDESLGRNCRFLRTGLQAQPATDQIRQALTAGEGLHVKLNNRRKDGRLFINELYLSPLHDRHGRLTNYIGVQHDVTVRESVMQRLEQSPLKIWQLDTELHTDFINSAWEDVVPHPHALPAPDIFTFLDPGGAEAVRQACTRTLRTGRPSGVDAQLSFISGERRWHHFSLTARTSDDGQTFGLTAAAVDVSAHRLSEETGTQRIQQLSFQSMLMRGLLRGAQVAPEAADQALEIVAEALDAEEAAIVLLEDGAEGTLRVRRAWSSDERSRLPASLDGRQLQVSFPSSSTQLLSCEEAMLLPLSEFEPGQEGRMLCAPLKRDGKRAGFLFARSSLPPAERERSDVELLRSVASVIASLL